MRTAGREAMSPPEAGKPRLERKDANLVWEIRDGSDSSFDIAVL
jgi:hypothetical protein